METCNVFRFSTALMLQVGRVRVVRDQLCCPGFSFEVQSVSPERPGPGLQQSSGLWSAAAGQFSAESRLYTECSEVSPLSPAVMTPEGYSWIIGNNKKVLKMFFSSFSSSIS